jgi:allophanate hydrolase
MARFLLHAFLYTRRCTGTVNALPPRLLTLDDWRNAYRQGADIADRLRALRATLAEGRDPAVIAVVGEDVLAGRLAALAALAGGRAPDAALFDAYPLYGVPFAVKDNIDVAGVETTAACPAFAHVATRTATVVARLEAAGAVWIAKTNLDQFATGLVGTRSPFGAPASVLAPDRVSGGSSSGSAVLVGRGTVPFALGTDTAGSGRIPAGFNQIVGLKPTPGRVSTAGVLPACRTLDCVSIFALTVDDAAEVLATIEGSDPDDPYSRFAPGPAGWPAALRVGVPQRPVFTEGDGYEPAWRQALGGLEAVSGHAVAIDMGVLDEVAALLYEGPWVAERHAVVGELLARRPDAFDPAVRAVIERARGFSATDAFAAQYRLRALAARADAIWAQCDVLMVPTAPGHPRFADLAADPIGANAQLGRYTNFVNLLGWCALALPAGTTAGGLPFGVTLIAPAGRDAALAALGRRWQCAHPLPMGATGVRAPVTADAATGGASASAAVLAAPTAAPAGPRRPRSEDALAIAVVGAHLSGLPLNGQLRERGATRVRATTTAPRYRLYALPGTVPPKPGLVRDEAAGHAIALEVWSMPQRHVGSFLALIARPLGLGVIELADGTMVHGFVCEAAAVAEATDISGFGGWRAWLEAGASAGRAQGKAEAGAATGASSASAASERTR